MVLVRINSASPPEIDWGASGVAEIAQNVFTLINTLQYEVAYDRTLGIKRDFVDMPEQEAAAFVTAQIYSVIDEREPRATVQEVNYLGMDEDGTLVFEVVVDI